MLRNNEKGNALIIVLVMVAVFFILYISIMGMTVNNSKQIMATEDKAQAVSIAEMGVTYYKTAIINESTALQDNETFNNSVHQLINDTIYSKYGTITAANKENIEKEINSPNYFNSLEEIAVAEYKKKLQLNLKEWNSDFFNTLTVSVDDSSNQLFSITNIKQLTTKDSIIYNFDSIGKTSDKTITLNSSLTIPVTLDPILLEATDQEDEANSGNSGENDNVEEDSSLFQTGLTGNDIADPGNLNACVDPIPNNYSFSNLKCQYEENTSITKNTDVNDTTIKVNGELTLSANINSFNRSTLYSTGNLTVNGNLMGNSAINIHSGGNMTFKQLNDTVSNSIIESAGNGIFNNLKTTNSTIYIGGTGTIDNINSFKDSKLEVNGSLTTGNWNNTSDSIISITGAASFNNLNSPFNNTNMTIKGSATFKNVNDLTDSSIRIGGAATFSVINGMDGSKIFVNGDATIGNLNLGDNSTLCVRETLDITGNFNKNGNGKVYAQKITANTKNKYGNYIDTDLTNFQTYCTGGYPDDSDSNNDSEGNKVYLPIVHAAIESEKSELDAEYNY